MNRRNARLWIVLPIALIVMIAAGVDAWRHPIPVHAQRSDTIVQQIMSNSAAVASTIPSNIGQSVHYFNVLSKDAPGKTCNAYFAAQLKGSYDGVRFIALPQQTLGAFVGISGSNTSRFYTANGAFPTIQLFLTTSDLVNCVYDAFYTGVLTGTTPFALVPGFPGSQGTLNTVEVIASAAGDNTLITNNVGVTTISVYQLTVCNLTSGQTVTMWAGPSSNNLLSFKLPVMGAAQCFTSPSSSAPFISTNFGAGSGAGGNLVANLTSATEVDFLLTYRFE